MEQNKTGKYLKYAIGEILLVVIGILIALSINNFNDKKKLDHKFNQSLKDVQEELVYNINLIDSLVLDHFRTDSLIYQIRNKLMTLEDFYNHYGYTPGFYSNSSSIQDDAFKSLVALNSPLNEGQAKIMRLLKKTHNELNDNSEIHYKETIEIIESEELYLSRNKGWYSDWKSRKINNEIANYFLSDSLHLNYLSRYSEAYLTSYSFSIQQQRTNAIRAVQLISNYLNEEGSLVSNKIVDYNHAIGTYETQFFDIPLKLVIDLNNGLLNYKEYENGSLVLEHEIIPYSKTKFITNPTFMFHHLILNGNNEVEYIRASDGITTFDFKKIN